MIGLFSSPAASHYLSVTDDNRIKLWDVQNDKLESTFTEKDHLTAGYTSLAWAPTPKSKKKSKSHSKFGLVALGTESGSIVIWNLSTGEVSARLGAESGTGHDSPVADVAFYPDGVHVVSCSATERNALVWNVASGEVVSKLKLDKYGANRVAVSADGQIAIAASTKVRSFDTTTNKKLDKFDGHSTPATTASVAPDSRLMVTSSSDRFLSAWPVRRATDPASDDSALRSFVSPSETRAVACAVVSAGSVYRLAAACADGHCRVWEHSSAASGKKPVPPACVLKSQSADWPVISVCFSGGEADSNKLTVAQGSALRPVFEHVTLPSTDGVLESEVTLSARGEGGLLLVDGVASGAAGAAAGAGAAAATDKDAGVAVGKASKGAPREPAVVGPEGMATLRASVVPPQEKPKKKRGRGEEEEKGGEEGDGVDSDADIEDFEKALEEFDAGTGRFAQDSDDEDDLLYDNYDGFEEATLQERLEELNGALAAEDDSEDDEEDGDAASAERARVAGLLAEGPTAASLSAVLLQALQTNDEAQLEMCLAMTDEAAIKQTIERLPASQVVGFLKLVIARFEAKPTRGVILSRWIRAVLVAHAAHLMSVPDLVHQLTGLYQTIGSRVKVFKKLLTLSGRLDMVLSQVTHQSNAKTGAGAADGRAGTVVVVDEDDEDLMEEDDEDDEDDSSDDESDEDVEVGSGLSDDE